MKFYGPDLVLSLKSLGLVSALVRSGLRQDLVSNSMFLSTALQKAELIVPESVWAQLLERERQSQAGSPLPLDGASWKVWPLIRMQLTPYGRTSKWTETPGQIRMQREGLQSVVGETDIWDSLLLCLCSWRPEWAEKNWWVLHSWDELLYHLSTVLFNYDFNYQKSILSFYGTQTKQIWVLQTV